MLHLVTAAALQNVTKTQQVGIEIGLRILQAVAYSGLSGQVDHMAEAFLFKKRGQGRAIGQISPHAAETGGLRQCRQLRQAVVFKLHVIVVVAVVQPHHRMPVGQQPPGRDGSR